MTTYCRITGKSRGLPKPNYFPLLPPISPADAKRFCRITGKAYGLPTHHYIPVLIGKPRNKKQIKRHTIIKGYKYYFPCLKDSPNLQEILTSKTQSGKNNQYVYTVTEKKCGLILTEELEAAVRDGDIQNLMLAKNSDTMLVKLKQSEISVGLEEVKFENITGELYEGEGVAVMKNKSSISSMKKIFENKEIEEEIECKKPKMEIRSWKNVETSKIEICPASFESWVSDDFRVVEGKTVIKRLPTPVSMDPLCLDISQSIPGLIIQPYIHDSYVGLNTVAIIAPFRPLIIQQDLMIRQCLKNLSEEEIRNCINPESLLDCALLPRIEDISKIVPLLEAGTVTIFEKDGRSINVAVVSINGEKKYIVGIELMTGQGKLFIPGQTVSIAGSLTFVPGVVINSGEECKMIPGEILTIDGVKMFLGGTTTLTSSGEKFVQGQFMVTPEGKIFVPGQTIYSKNEIGFIPGQISTSERFLPGITATRGDDIEFVPGQYLSVDQTTNFVPGKSIWTEEGWEFVAGKTILTETGKKFIPGIETKQKFLPGQFALENGNSIFVPGKTVEEDILKFVPGMTVETEDGNRFVEGQILETANGQQFVPGKTKVLAEELEFIPAGNSSEIDYGIETYVEKKEQIFSEGVFGHIVQSKLGVEFFPGQAVGLPSGKVVPGKLLRGSEIKFVPGVMIDGEFVPGQVVMTDSGKDFIPGQVIETSEGPKFVPGQIVQSKGVSKFVPGQTVQTPDGPKFIPGQIIETGLGPTFIPGQVIFTEEGGSKFVPGEVVETSEGPRFVPGKVIESGESVTFVPGHVVETKDGLRFVAPDLIGEDNEDKEFTVQGFEISPEELGLLQPRSCAVTPKSWEMPIDSKMLSQLSEAGMRIGRQVNTEVPNIELPAIDVKFSLAMNVASTISKKLVLDPVTTVKISQIILAVVQLCKVGEISGSSEECNTINKILERVVHCKNNEEAYKIIANIIEKEFSSNMIEKVDKIHSYISSSESPLKKLNKLSILKEILNYHSEPIDVIDKLSIILNDEENGVCYALKKLSETSSEIVPLIVERLSSSIESFETETEAVDTLHKIIVAAVRETTEMKIVELLKDSEKSSIKTLIMEAIGLAKALEMHDTVVILSRILSDPQCYDILAGDKLSLELLRRITVMRQLANRKPEHIEALKMLKVDPYGLRNNPSIRQLVRESGALLVIPEVEISSKSVPTPIFSQNSLAMEEFLTRTKRVYKTLVIIKNGIQAIIPREAAHSVLTGSEPYMVLDERGLHLFQPKHVFSALKLPKIATHWFSSYKCEMVDKSSNIKE